MKTLKINIFELSLIKCNQIQDFQNLGYKMYAIISIPRMYFKEPTISEEFIKYTVTDRKKDFYFNEKIEFEGDSKEFNIVSDYPCELMHINDDVIIASDAFLNCDFLDKKIRIEYIGISTKHDATERLKNHSKLQSILSQFHSEHCYRDLYICLFNAEHFDIKTLDQNASDDDIEKFIDKMGEAYDKDEVVTALTEASLINIFKPKFNDEYSKSSSNTKFKTLDDLYSYGFDNCIIHLSLFSKNKDEKSGSVTIYTDSKCLELNKDNGFQTVLECPFRNLNNER